MGTTGIAKHSSLKIIFFCHVLLAKSPHILFTNIIQHLFPLRCLVLLHGKPCLSLKQTWCYFDFLFEIGSVWYLPGSTVSVKQYCAEKVKAVPSEGFHHQPSRMVHQFNLLGGHRARCCRCPVPGGSLLEAASLPGSQGPPEAIVQLLPSQRMGPILLCSGFIFFSLLFFSFFYLFIFFLLSWSIHWVFPVGRRGISPNCDTEVIRNANRGGKDIVQ